MAHGTLPACSPRRSPMLSGQSANSDHEPMQASQAALDLERVQAIIDSPEGEAAPGCALAIFRDGESQHLFSGFADIEAGRRPDADTLYYAGSLAKQFTALAVVQLVLAGQIELQTPARRYLPELAARTPTSRWRCCCITPRVCRTTPSWRLS